MFEKRDIHIHVPDGATPKDGPTRGRGDATAFVSALTGIPVRCDVAMTGEITLRGEVLPIGGLKEKLLAARRGGIKTVLIPEENVKDLQDIPENVKNQLEIDPGALDRPGAGAGARAPAEAARRRKGRPTTCRRCRRRPRPTTSRRCSSTDRYAARRRTGMKAARAPLLRERLRVTARTLRGINRIASITCVRIFARRVTSLARCRIHRRLPRCVVLDTARWRAL